MKRTALFFLVVSCAAAQQPIYDVLLKGGHVVDAKQNIDAVRDVAIAGGKIAAVAADIPASQARRTVDAKGLYVTPGLVDIHTHLYNVTDSTTTPQHGIRPDGFTFRNGVTTVAEAGTTGWRNFEHFKSELIDHVETRVFAWINIVGSGMGGRNDIEQNLLDMDPVKTADMAKRYKDTIVGIKIAHYKGPEWIPVERAVEAGTLANIPVMVDFADFRPERPFQDLVLKKLRPGDIYTHTYLNAVPMIDPDGKVMPYLFEAKKRGIIFDLGHGSGSFSFNQAVPAIKQGFYVDSVSTDYHAESMNGGLKDIDNLMSKLINMGMSVEDVLVRTTRNPAREIHHEELGTLAVGSAADVAVFRVVMGEFGFLDSSRRKMMGTKKLVCELTLKDGRTMYDLNGLMSDDWTKAPPRRPNTKR
jgi:dihydroorotase